MAFKCIELAVCPEQYGAELNSFASDLRSIPCSASFMWPSLQFLMFSCFERIANALVEYLVDVAQVDIIGGYWSLFLINKTVAKVYTTFLMSAASCAMILSSLNV